MGHGAGRISLAPDAPARRRLARVAQGLEPADLVVSGGALRQSASTSPPETTAVPPRISATRRQAISMSAGVSPAAIPT